MSQSGTIYGRVGINVTIHPTAVFFKPEKVFLGNNVRIDCFCLLSAGEEGIHIGNNVHLAAGVYIFGGGGKVVMEDFTCFSSRVAVYTVSDDFTGGAMTNPTIPEKYRSVRKGPVVLKKHALVGAGSVVMPGVQLGVGVAVGALSFVNRSVEDFQIVGGTPLRSLGTRGQRLLELEKEFLEEAQKNTNK